MAKPDAGGLYCPHLTQMRGHRCLSNRSGPRIAGRNFNYLIACPETGEALAVDPLDAEKCLAAAKRRGWTITQILNTHEHRDHTGGNDQMIAATGAKLLAHANAKDRIAGIDRGLKAGDAIKVGRTVELECLDTPGHTMSHICVLAHGATRALFCGDTLFNAGAGNCHNGGHPNELYNTFATQLSKLPDDTLVYPGHDYICNNLRFTLDREPDNAKAKELLPDLEEQDTSRPFVTNSRARKGDQHVFPPDQPVGNPPVARGFPRSAGQPRPEDGLSEAARIAQQMVKGAR